MRTYRVPFRIAFACLLGCVFAPLALAQTTEADLSASLKGKALLLRGMWAKDILAFSEEGKPLLDYGQMPFTECGFEARSVKLRADGLHIEGQRMALEFNQKGNRKWVRISGKDYDGNMQIVISGHSGQDFEPALDAIFVRDLADIVPSLPSYWQHYARRNLVPTEVIAPAADAQKTSLSRAAPVPVGGPVKPPHILKSAEPGYNPVARLLMYSANVQVYLWVDEQGVPSHLAIARPAGAGLDEQALAAVAKYRFEPATQNGKPVKVDLYIDVNFQIF